MGIVMNAQLLGGGEAVAFIFVANATPNTEIYATANKTYHATADVHGQACIGVGEVGAFTITNGILTASVTVPANGGVAEVALPWTPQYATESGSVVSFNAVRSAPLSSLAVDITPVQSGSGTPAYDNVRPISGFSEAKITRTGKNWWTAPYDISKPSFYATGWYGITTSGEWVVQTGYSTAIGAFGGACCYNLPAGTYTISCDVDASQCVSNQYTVTFLTKYVGESYTQSSQYNLTASHYTKTITLAKAVDCIAIRITSYGNSNSAVVRYKNIQLEIGSPATAYEPYDGDTYTIDLDGTRYGGTLDVLTGVLTVDRGFIQLDGNSNVTVTGSGTTQPTDVLPYWATVQISATPKSDYNYANWMFSHGIIQYAAYAGIFRFYYQSSTAVRTVVGTETLCNTTALIQSWLQAQYDAGTPLQMVYELQTPITVQLTAQQVETLVGQNYIWADTGDTTVTYLTN